MILWILAGLLVLFLLSNSREYMTNSDLISTLKTFGDKNESPKKKEKTPVEAPIYGPKTSELEHPKPTVSPGISDSGVYPDIYGPEYEGVPGSTKKANASKVTKNNSGKHESDADRDEDAYQFNPDLQKAFPTNGPPQPFLTDFSKFQQ
jgi:hypothetical protein